MNTNTLERIKNSFVIKIEDSQSIKYYYNWDGISFLTEIKDGGIYTMNQGKFTIMNESDELTEAILETILPDISINLNTNKPEFIFGSYNDTYVYLNNLYMVVNDIPTYTLVSDKGTMFVEDHGYFVNVGKQTYSKVVARKLIEVLEMLRCKDLNQTNEEEVKMSNNFIFNEGLITFPKLGDEFYLVVSKEGVIYKLVDITNPDNSLDVTINNEDISVTKSGSGTRMIIGDRNEMSILEKEMDRFLNILRNETIPGSNNRVFVRFIEAVGGYCNFRRCRRLEFINIETDENNQMKYNFKNNDNQHVYITDGRVYNTGVKENDGFRGIVPCTIESSIVLNYCLHIHSKMLYWQEDKMGNKPMFKLGKGNKLGMVTMGFASDIDYLLVSKAVIGGATHYHLCANDDKLLIVSENGEIEVMNNSRNVFVKITDNKQVSELTCYLEQVFVINKERFRLGGEDIYISLTGVSGEQQVVRVVNVGDLAIISLKSLVDGRDIIRYFHPSTKTYVNDPDKVLFSDVNCYLFNLCKYWFRIVTAHKPRLREEVESVTETNEACNYTKTIEDIKSSKYNDLEAYTLLINGVTRIEYDGNCYYVTTSISDDEDSDEWHFHHDDLDVVIEYLQFVKRHI